MEAFETVEGLLIDFASAFSAMTPSDQIGWLLGVSGFTLCSVGGAFISLLGWRSATHRLKTADQRNADLLRDKSAAERRALAADQERARVSPQEWLQRAHALESAGQEELAIEHLRVGFENVRIDFANVALKLAKHHAERGGIREQEWGEARQLAHLAAILNDKSRDAVALANELDEVVAESHFTRNRFNAADPLWSAPIEPEPTVDAVETIAQLTAKASTYVDRGHDFLGLRLASFAIRLAKGSKQFNSLRGCVARFVFARALLGCDRATAALDEIESVSPILTDLVGDESPALLGVRALRVRTLNVLGRSQEALAEMDQLMPLATNVRGSNDEWVLGLKFLYAETLHGLERREDALSRINALMPILKRVLGEEHTQTLLARYTRALLLAGLDQGEVALREIDEVSSIESRVLGKAHPQLMLTKMLRARVLDDLGRSEEALAEIDELTTASKASLGKRRTFELGILRAQVLKNLDRPQEAISELASFAAAQLELLGPAHPSVFARRYEYAHALLRQDQFEESLKEIDTYAPDQARILGSEHPQVFGTSLLRCNALRHLGRLEEALAELQSLLQVQTGKLGEGHKRVLQARELYTQTLVDLGRQNDDARAV